MNGFGWSFLRRDKKLSLPVIDPQHVPEHVAIIMDGNGRWASRRGLPRIAGHRSGMSAVKRITMAANEIGIKILTLYAFSTENWKRPKDEVDYLMMLPQEFLAIELDELVANNVRIGMIGNRAGLPDHTLRALDEAQLKTKHNTGLKLVFALNYGSRSEMLTGVKQMAELIKQGHLQPEEITEEHFSDMLFTSGLPDPDLLIRTSGEQRISNFMLWQIAYSELAFVDEYWPDFSKEQFFDIILQYQRRNRRFGAI